MRVANDVEVRVQVYILQKSPCVVVVVGVHVVCCSRCMDLIVRSMDVSNLRTVSAYR